MPTFNDLYYTTVGSKTLDPEDATQLDLGAEWTAVESGSHHFAMKVDVYWNQLRNKIIAVPTSNQFRWSMYNLGKVSVLGGDVTADYSFAFDEGEAGLIARYTLQRSRDRSDPEALTWNGQIPYIPLHSGSVNLYGSRSGWRADLTLFATGERFTTSANLPAYRLAPWATLDAAVSKDITLKTGSLSLKLRLNNLLNEQYCIVDNYPMPGLNFLMGIVYTI
jgi:outer membrane receptor protein involved in Fe transport